MPNFKGFNEKTNDYLIGIRFNNNKEFFHANKESYRLNVHEPMAFLGQDCYEYLHKLDKNFNETPKISRANRDIRFSKDKRPYKENKWFFLRGDGSPNIVYPHPTYFFEISADWFRYGFFFAPKPIGMANYRKKADADLSRFERMIASVEKIDGFKLEGEDYKRKFSKDMPDRLSNWYNKKWIEVVKYCDYTDLDFYNEKLVDKVCKDFERLYPAYQYFNSIQSE